MQKMAAMLKCFNHQC